MAGLRTVRALVACGILVSLTWAVYAQKPGSGPKDISNAGKATHEKPMNSEEPDVVEISREKFACNVDVIKIGNLKDAGWYKKADSGFFELAREKESPLLPLRGKTIGWWCGAASEDFQADEGAQYIVVQRGPRGAGNLIYYKKK